MPTIYTTINGPDHSCKVSLKSKPVCGQFLGLYKTICMIRRTEDDGVLRCHGSSNSLDRGEHKRRSGKRKKKKKKKTNVASNTLFYQLDAAQLGDLDEKQMTTLLTSVISLFSLSAPSLSVFLIAATCSLASCHCFII